MAGVLRGCVGFGGPTTDCVWGAPAGVLRVWVVAWGGFVRIGWAAGGFESGWEVGGLFGGCPGVREVMGVAVVGFVTGIVGFEVEGGFPCESVRGRVGWRSK